MDFTPSDNLNRYCPTTELLLLAKHVVVSVDQQIHGTKSVSDAAYVPRIRRSRIRWYLLLSRTRDKRDCILTTDLYRNVLCKGRQHVSSWWSPGSSPMPDSGQAAASAYALD